jgi:oligosaccharide repeat unit polymerase
VLSPLLFFRHFFYQKQKFIFYIAIGIYVILFLSIGDRGPALYLLTLLFGLYTFYIKKISLRYIFIFCFSGLILMHIIGKGRMKSERDVGIIRGGIERAQSESANKSILLNSTESFVVNTRNLYVGLEHVEKEGLNWGQTSLLSSVVSVIPFAQSTLENYTDLDIETSADFFTTLEFGKNRSYGLGTNLVADVYISFGFLGCIILFFLFGFLIEFSRKRIILKNGMYSNIIYFTLLSYSIYYPRTGLFMPLKYLVWSLLIYYFFILLIRAILNNQNKILNHYN